MLLHALSGFEEFQNTEEGRKVQFKKRDSEPTLRFRRIKYKNRTDVAIVFNRALLRLMKDNKVLDFKILFNEKTQQVAIKYDNSNGKKTLVGRNTRHSGDILLTDKYVTATMLPLLTEEKPVITYKCKNIVDKIIFIFNRE